MKKYFNKQTIIAAAVGAVAFKAYQDSKTDGTFANKVANKLKELGSEVKKEANDLLS